VRSHKRPSSHRRAYAQVIHTQARAFVGHTRANRVLLHQMAQIVAWIWCQDQVGFFQLRLKHLHDFLARRYPQVPRTEREQVRAALARLCQARDKAHWIPALGLPPPPQTRRPRAPMDSPPPADLFKHKKIIRRVQTKS